MKVIICGGRDFRDYEYVFSVLDGLHVSNKFTHVIHGGANGVDLFAGDWAMKNGVQEVRCNANWEKYGRSAGFQRNLAMALLKPDLVVAFPGGKGTAMMVQIAKDAKIAVIQTGERPC